MRDECGEAGALQAEKSLLLGFKQEVARVIQFLL